MPLGMQLQPNFVPSSIDDNPHNEIRELPFPFSAVGQQLYADFNRSSSTATTTAIEEEDTSTHEETKQSKKPPRPYTEYNIFFQLERERILGELEKEQQEKTDGESSSNEPSKEGESTDPSKKSGNEGAKSSSQENIMLNHPSDPGDILPRPAQFAHLQLSPYWYDSTYRLQQSKMTKNRRKHRKTHGLVGFLDLTRRIAKAWSEANEETKSYCKRVADRQLQVYKGELKILKNNPTGATATIKKSQDVTVEDGAVAGENKKAPKVTVTKAPSSFPMPPVHHGGRNITRHDMPPPPPPPPPPQPSRGYKYNNTMQRQQQQGPSDPRATNPRYCPALPLLSPKTEYYDERYAVPGSKVHPLDELMHRRKIYGSRSHLLQQQHQSITTFEQESKRRKRKRDAIEVYDLTSSKSNPKREECDENSPKCGNVIGNLESKATTTAFLSPTNMDGSTPDDETNAITPSPSSRKETPSREESTLPMKKRHKKLDHDDDGTTASTPGSWISGAPAASTFSISPSDIMTPREGMGPFMSSPLSASSYRKALGPYLGDSPFPYIDCFSPQEGGASVNGSPRSDDNLYTPSSGNGRDDSYHQHYQRTPSMHPQFSPGGVPPHLTVPGSWHFNNNSSQRFPTSPLDANDDFSEAEVLDLDEEEMQTMWKKLASHAKRRRQRVAAAWMYANEGGGGVNSPCAPYESYSFSSPIENTGADTTKM